MLATTGLDSMIEVARTQRQAVRHVGETTPAGDCEVAQH